jgi:NADH-quinone oxidoreductase subunit F
MKWQFCVDSKEDDNYLICNADEGDPGAFMNRSLLESDPHSVLEGILIAAYAIGVNEGYIYCRAEYPLALERLKHAISEMKRLGFLGENILGSGFNFDIKIKEGAGAFVCGEETALIASIEGKRGMPRTRPPFPTTSGLWGKPTVINNVETMASVSLIMQAEPEEFVEHGTEDSKGTKTFSLVGNVKNTGLIEVPLGTTLRQVINEIGGGIINDGVFKAVQIGGPSGGCIPESYLDTRIDYDSLTMAGAIMGSGGLVVMDQNSCMVDVAHYFLEFIQNESCGKCVPCRLGTKQMLDILTDITNGKGKSGDIDLLLELAGGVKDGSLCGLGQTSPNPILTTIKYFKNEYDAHINEKRCPALLCKELINYQVIEEKCKGCMLCFKSCPVGAISGSKKEIHNIDTNKCIKCGTCIELCSGTYSAIERVSKY